MQCGCVEKVCSWTWWNLWGQAKAIIKGPGPPSGGAWWWWAFNVWCTTSSSCIVLVVWCSTTVWCSTNGGDAEVAGSCCVSCHQVFRLWPGWESINWMWHNLKLTESMSLVKRHASDWVLSLQMTINKKVVCLVSLCVLSSTVVQSGLRQRVTWSIWGERSFRIVQCLSLVNFWCCNWWSNLGMKGDFKWTDCWVLVENRLWLSLCNGCTKQVYKEIEK